MSADLVDNLFLEIRREGVHIGHLRLAEDLKAFGVDKLDEPGEGEAHSLHQRMADLLVQSVSSRQQGEIQMMGFVLIQHLNRNGVHRFNP